MSAGKLWVIKSVGERPTFCLLDKEGNPITIIPDFTGWAMKRTGTMVDLFVSDDHFEITLWKYN